MSVRILYVGNDLLLQEFLQANLEGTIVRCAGLSQAQVLIKGIDYSLIVLDRNMRKLRRLINEVRKETPVLLVSDPPENLVKRIKNQLNLISD